MAVLPASAQTAPAEPAARPEAEPNVNTEAGAPSVHPATRESRFSRPAEREIRFQEGLLHYSRGQLDRAEQDFQSIVSEDPADAEAFYYLGLSQLDQNKSQAAVENFTQSLRLDPTPDELHAARAAALIRLKRFDQAEQDIAVLEADPRWQGLVHYLRGHLNYSKGNLDAAARDFAAARQSGQAEAMPPGLYYALTPPRLIQLCIARRIFRAAAVGAEGDPEVTSAAQQLDTVLARYGRERRRLDAQLTVGYEWDSNVIQLGDQPLPTGITNESDSTLVVQPRVRYSVFRKAKLDLGAEGSGYFTWHQDLNDFDLASYQGGPYLNYTIRKNLYASARYSFNYVTLGNDPFLIRHMATPQLTLIEPEFGYTSGYYQWQSRQFQEPTVLEPFDRDGQVHRIGVIQGIYLPPIFKGADKSTLELSYRFENQQTQGSDFDADFHTVGATVYVPLPWWKLKGDIGATYGFDLYDNRNSLENDPFVIEAADDRRRDGELNLSVGLTKKFNDWLSARVDYTYTDNESNITAADGTQPYDYDRHVVGARLILSY
jgi:tetratricopeptide (TPR) repeat protein